MSPDVERRQAKVMCVYKYSVYYMVTRLISKFFLYLHCTYNQQRMILKLITEYEEVMKIVGLFFLYLDMVGSF